MHLLVLLRRHSWRDVAEYLFQFQHARADNLQWQPNLDGQFSRSQIRSSIRTAERQHITTRAAELWRDSLRLCERLLKSVECWPFPLRILPVRQRVRIAAPSRRAIDFDADRPLRVRIGERYLLLI